MSDPHACRLLRSPWPGVFGTDIESARHYDRHWHTTFGMGVMERAAHRSMSGRGVVDAHAGDVITTNPGEVHDGRPLGRSSRRWRMVYLEATAMASMVGDGAMCSADVQLTRPVIQDRRLALMLRDLLARLDGWNGSSDGALACEESLVVACGLMLRDHSTIRLDRQVGGDVRRARERLADDVDHTPSLSELAMLVGLSKYQLLRRFRRAYGVTPHEWLRQVRIERARASIGGGATLAQVAAACGFADQSHMTRAFVEHFGFTPGAWQRTVARQSARP